LNGGCNGGGEFVDRRWVYKIWEIIILKMGNHNSIYVRVFDGYYYLTFLYISDDIYTNSI